MAKVLTMTIAGVVNIRVSLLLPLVDHSEWVEMFGSEGLNDTLEFQFNRVLCQPGLVSFESFVSFVWRMKKRYL